MRKMSTLVLVLIFFPFLFAFAKPEAESAPQLEERRIEGADATVLAEAMKESGAKKEPLGENGGASLPSEHPQIKIGKDYVYRMESIVCEKGKCSPFVLDAPKMKSVEAIFRRAGVKETKAPTRKTPPILYLRDLSCGAEADAGAEIACFATGHFKPKPKPKREPKPKAKAPAAPVKTKK